MLRGTCFLCHVLLNRHSAFLTFVENYADIYQLFHSIAFCFDSKTKIASILKHKKIHPSILPFSLSEDGYRWQPTAQTVSPLPHLCIPAPSQLLKCAEATWKHHLSLRRSKKLLCILSVQQWKTKEPSAGVGAIFYNDVRRELFSK